jgi:hypothetical protein
MVRRQILRIEPPLVEAELDHFGGMRVRPVRRFGDRRDIGANEIRMFRD